MTSTKTARRRLLLDGRSLHCALCFVPARVPREASMSSSSSSSSSSSLQVKRSLSPADAEAAIERLVRFFQFETVSILAPSTGAYKACAAWLVDQLKLLLPSNDDVDVFLLPEAPEHSPVVVAVWKGLDETLPVILLNSHYDVVPAKVEDWSVDTPPFAGVRKNGNVYGRGAQDMKCVCLQYIEALRQIHLQKPEWKPARSIYLTFVPDEEVGGGGMTCFLESQVYKNLPNGIALALDEGLASTSDTYAVFYGERLPWWVDVTATGPTGHGSRFVDHTAVEQLVALANKALAFRQGQRRELMGEYGDEKHENCSHAVARGKKKTTLGDVTSLNITTLQAGVPVGNTFAYNCVPPVAKCSLDIRIAPHVAPATIGAMLDQWCQECSSSSSSSSDASDNNNNDGSSSTSTLTWSFLGDQGNPLNAMQGHSTTSTNVQQNPWYGVFCDAMAEQQLSIDPQVFPAATDSRFLRALGIRALGFSPMKNTESLLHENDEYIPEQVYLDGIQVYTGLLYKLASQTKEIDELASTVLQENGASANGHA